MDKMRTGVVILARCKSERFPGKVLAPLGGRPILSWLIAKAWKVKPDVVVVATSTEPEDDATEALCHEEMVSCYRGPNLDVMARVRMAWETYGITHAVEFSGDCPFIDLAPAQRIHDAMLRNPEFDQYDCSFYPSGVLGIMCCGRRRSYWEKLAALTMEQPEAERALYLEWPWYFLPRGVSRFSSLPIQTADLYAPDKTPISLVVDYPLQLWFLDKLVRKLGGVPDTYDPVEKAFRNLAEL